MSHTHRVAPFMPEGQEYWEARCVDPGCPLDDLLVAARAVLRMYPKSIFTGESGDVGARRVVALRRAVEKATKPKRDQT